MGPVELSEFYKQAQSLTPQSSKERIYFAVGDEFYLKREIFHLLKAKLMPDNSEFNYTHLDLDKTDVQTLDLEARSYPMMAESRLVTVDVYQSISEQKLKDFFGWIESAELYDTHLVVQFEKLDLKKTFVQKTLSKVTYIECKTPYSYQIPTWIQQIAARYQLRFRDEAGVLFHSRVGDSLAQIDLEIQKLQGFAEQGWISEALVSKLVVFSQEARIFESIKDFFSRNSVKTCHSFQQLIEGGESPVLLVSLLARHTRLLLKVHAGHRSGIQGVKLAQALRVPLYFLKQYEKDAKLWSRVSLKNLILKLNQLDRSLKTTSLNPVEILLNWTVESI